MREKVVAVVALVLFYAVLIYSCEGPPRLLTIRIPTCSEAPEAVICTTPKESPRP